MTQIILLLFFFLMLLGLPLYIGLLAMGIILYTGIEQLPLESIIISFHKLTNQEFISAIPLFTFAGYCLSKSKSPERLVNLFKNGFSFLPGFDIVIVLLMMALFTALTGASGVSILALGGLMLHMLVSTGKDQRFSQGLIAGSGSIGLLFAPSLPMIIYAIVASQNLQLLKVDINVLFKTAFIPGVFIIIVFTTYGFIANRKRIFKKFSAKKNSISNFGIKEQLKAFWYARYELLLPIIVYGGIYSGLFTVLEASIVTVLYVFLVTFIIHRDLEMKNDFIEMVIESLKLSGSIFIIMASAFVLTNYLVDQSIPDKVFQFISPYLKNKSSFLIAINIFLLLSGCLLDIFSAILILLPILIPIVEQYGINPYHFAIIFLVNLEIGYLTPPVGMNLFIAAYRFKQPILKIYQASFPYLLLLLFCLIVITFWSPLSMTGLSETQKKIADTTPPLSVKHINLIEKKKYQLTFQFALIKDQSDNSLITNYQIKYFDEEIISEDDFEFAEEVFTKNKIIDYLNETLTFNISTENFLKDNLWIVIRTVDATGNVSIKSKNFIFKIFDEQ